MFAALLRPTPASLLVSGGWATAFALFLGLGELAAPLLLGRDPRRRLSVSFWIGWGAALGALQLWHLALPVDGRAVACLAPVGVAGLVLLARRLRQSPPVVDRLDALGWVLAAVLVSWAARRALLPPLNGDVCSYHLQAVRWASTYPIVPGLGNLLRYFGRNTSYPLYVALLDVGPFWHRAEHLANGLLFLAVAVPALFRTLDLFRSAPRRSSWMWAVAFGLALDELLGPNLSSPAADGAMWCLLALTALFTLEPILDREPMGEDQLRLSLLTALFGVLVKPSNLIAAGVFGVFALTSFLRSRSSLRTRSLLGAGAAVFLLFVAPWVARGYLVSGYPLYPATVGDLDLEWRIPASVAADDRADIDSYDKYRRTDFVHGRTPGPWLAGWLGREWLDNRRFLLPVGGWALGLIALGALAFVRRRAPPLAVALLPLTAFAALWLRLLPDTRFAGPLLWFGLVVTILCAAEIAGRAPGFGDRWLAVGAVLLMQACAFVGALPQARDLPGTFAPAIRETFSEALLPSGEAVHEARLCCTELPCVLDARRVRTRRRGDFSHGFVAN